MLKNLVYRLIYESKVHISYVMSLYVVLTMSATSLPHSLPQTCTKTITLIYKFRKRRDPVYFLKHAFFYVFIAVKNSPKHNNIKLLWKNTFRIQRNGKDLILEIVDSKIRLIRFQSICWYLMCWLENKFENLTIFQLNNN